MYYHPWMYGPHYQYPSSTHTPMYHHPEMANYVHGQNAYSHWHDPQQTMNITPGAMKDYGKKPFVTNIQQAALHNQTYRTALWTGKHLQVTLMSLHPGEDIGLEMHPTVDQFLRVEQGQGMVQMGKTKEHLDFVRNVHAGDAILIPAGYWHNLTNVGNIPLKLYSLYAPPQHPPGTVHPTKMDAQKNQKDH